MTEHELPFSDAYEVLAWDSAFWGFPIARVRGNRLSPDVVPGLDAWCRMHDIRCVYFLARADDFQSTRVAEESGFRVVDVRLTFARATADAGCKSDHQADQSPVRPALLRDIPELRQIARASYYDTRFYYDQRFPRERSDELYATWIEKSCLGWASVVLVAEQSSGVVGYISCHVQDGSHHGSIGLVGVRDDARGRGVALYLVQRALSWFAANGVAHATVTTQVRNVSAQRLYQRAGFLTSDVGVWFHRWQEDMALSG